SLRRRTPTECVPRRKLLGRWGLGPTRSLRRVGGAGAVERIAYRPAGKLRQHAAVPAHILAARRGRATGRSLDIAPPGGQRAFGPLRAASQW
ncbi:MAG: hypothetical protein OXG72_16355, partial [Acidobacteria bacterium]|nr:hypothetical protein [Acidobacteriota bacterium]